MPRKQLTVKEIEAAANRAAEALLAAIKPAGARTTDLVNLQVNVTVHFAEHPDATLEEALAANYSTPPEEVLAWARE
jgi:hypothetical protein